METEIKTEGDVVDTTTNEGEGKIEENTVSLSKEEYDTLNQTLGSLKKELKDLRKSAKESKETKETPEKTEPNELSSGDKALLVAYGVKGKEEQALAQSYMRRTGDDIDSLIEDDIFQAKLAKLREAKASQIATPSGTKRSTVSTKDDVDYHVEQHLSGKMKLEDMPFEMRTKVVNKMVEDRQREQNFNFK